MQTMFFSKLFNKSKSTDNKPLVCCHCRLVCDKLKKCDQCHKRLICRNCYHGIKGRMEQMCTKCDNEYIHWLRKVNELQEADKINQMQKEKENEYKVVGQEKNKNNMAGALLQDYY